MSNNKKEYSIVINGVTVAIRDVTKLDDALKALDKTAGAGVSVNVAATKAVTAKTKGLTDEEKAAKKLAATQERLTKVNGEANRAQIEANQQLRERTREVTREIALNNLAEGSIKAMGMQLTNLRNEYEGLSEEERNNVEVGGAMLTQIQALDKSYKELRESTGNFRDSVGNYEKALNGLDKLGKGLGQVGGSVNGLSAAFGHNSDMAGAMGSAVLLANSAQTELAKIIAIVTVLSQLSNAVTKEGIVATTAKSVADKIATYQLRAKATAEALATKGTIAATVAQWAFNVAAYANPYVLLAMALLAVVAALAYFATNTKDATEAQKELNEQQKIWLDYLDSEAARLNLVSNARVHALERQIKLLDAQGNKTKEIREIEDKIYREKVLQNARLRGMYHEEVTALEENRTKLQGYYDLMRSVQLAQARGDNKMYLDIDLNGKAKEVKVEDAVNIVQGKLDVLNKKVEIGVKLKTEEADLAAAADITKAIREAEDKETAKKAAEEAKRAREEAKQKAEEARKNAQERAALELEAQRAAEDLKLKLLGQSYEAQRQLITKEYDRQVQDLRLRLKNETNLTTKARQAINAQIVALEAVKIKELDALTKERNAKDLETTRQLEDQRTALILGVADRRRAEINLIYDRQIEDVKHRLATEEGLTEIQQKALNDMIIGYAQQRARELDALAVENINRRTNLELSATEQGLKDSLNAIGDIVKRNRVTGIIDVDTTKANLTAANAAYGEYIQGLVVYQDDLKKEHLATLATLKEGTVEYEEELQRYAQANSDATAKIKDAQKQLSENTRAAVDLQVGYYQSLFNNIALYADVAASAINSVVDTLNMGLQVSLDSLNEQLDVINEHYDKAKDQRERYAQDVVTIEEKVQSATGGTQEALRSQLQDAMHLRDEAAREEARLQKEKEKKEAEIAKKEKQMKRNELIGKIAMGVANTAQGITQALTLMWPLNLVMAGVVGAMGAVQTGIMTKQLTKLADGGEIVGPTHANGGVRVNGTDIEVEGGEFVTNRRSYAANRALVSFINDSPTTLTAADLAGIVPGFDALPVAVADVADNSDDRIIEAIEGMDFRPVVSVTDIIDVTNDVTTVKDLSGF